MYKTVKDQESLKRHIISLPCVPFCRPIRIFIYPADILSINPFPPQIVCLFVCYARNLFLRDIALSKIP